MKKSRIGIILFCIFFAMPLWAAEDHDKNDSTIVDRDNVLVAPELPAVVLDDLGPSKLTLKEAKEEARRLGQQFQKHALLLDQLLQNQDWKLHFENLSPKTKEELEIINKILADLEVIHLRSHQTVLLNHNDIAKNKGLKRLAASAAAFIGAMAARHFLKDGSAPSGILHLVEFIAFYYGVNGAAEAFPAVADEEQAKNLRGKLGQRLLDWKIQKTKALIFGEFVKAVGPLPSLALTAREWDMSSIQGFHGLVSQMEAKYDCKRLITEGPGAKGPSDQGVDRK